MQHKFHGTPPYFLIYFVRNVIIFIVIFANNSHAKFFTPTPPPVIGLLVSTGWRIFVPPAPWHIFVTTSDCRVFETINLLCEI